MKNIMMNRPLLLIAAVLVVAQLTVAQAQSSRTSLDGKAIADGG